MYKYGPGYVSQYSNPLWASSCRNQIPEGWDFLYPSRPALGYTQPPVQWTLGLLPGGKAAWVWLDHPPPTCAKVKERVELHFYSPAGPSWSILGWTLLLPMYKIIQLEATPPLYFPLPAITTGRKTTMEIPELETTLNVGFWNYVWWNTWKIHFLRPHCYRVQHRGEFRPRQIRQLPRTVDLKGRLLSCQSY